MPIMDEKAQAEQLLLLETILPKDAYAHLRLLAKYFVARGHSLVSTKEQLYAFLEKRLPGYHPVSWAQTVTKLAEQCYRKKASLIYVETIMITKNEMAAISKLRTPRPRKVMFTLLCLAKYYNAINPNNHNWVNTKDTEIFKLARASCNAEERAKLFYSLSQLGYIAFAQTAGNLNIQCLIADSPEESPTLVLTDFRELGYQYLKSEGKAFTACKKCGVLIPQKKGQAYCIHCAAKTAELKSNYSSVACPQCGVSFPKHKQNSKSILCPACYQRKRTHDVGAYVKKWRKSKAVAAAEASPNDIQ